MSHTIYPADKSNELPLLGRSRYIQILILDEATSMLDPQGREEVFSWSKN